MQYKKAMPCSVHAQHLCRIHLFIVVRIRIQIVPCVLFTEQFKHTTCTIATPFLYKFRCVAFQRLPY